MYGVQVQLCCMHRFRSDQDRALGVSIIRIMYIVPTNQFPIILPPPHPPPFLSPLSYYTTLYSHMNALHKRQGQHTSTQMSGRLDIAWKASLCMEEAGLSTHSYKMTPPGEQA